MRRKWLNDGGALAAIIFKMTFYSEASPNLILIIIPEAFIPQHSEMVFPYERSSRKDFCRKIRDFCTGWNPMKGAHRNFQFSPRNYDTTQKSKWKESYKYISCPNVQNERQPLRF